MLIFVYLGTPTRAVVGITLGVIAAAVVAVTALIIVAVAVWMYRCRGHHKCELTHGQNDEEMQVSRHDTSSHKKKNAIITGECHVWA